MSLHPVHLTPDDKGALPPSALVPFCSYQGESTILGERRLEQDNLTLCNKFEPTIFDGQLCYSLDMTKVEETKAGKTNGLWILLDPNPFRLNVSNEIESDDQMHNFKVYVHTLASYTAFGPGEYAMTALKRMKGTKSFKQLPDKQKKCQAHNREECQTRKFLDQVRNNCSCVPWPLMTNNKEQVRRREKVHKDKFDSTSKDLGKLLNRGKGLTKNIARALLSFFG